VKRSLGFLVFLGLALAPAVASAQDKPVYVTGGGGYFDLGAEKAEPAPTLQIQLMPGTRSLSGDAPAGRSFSDPAPVTGSAALQGSGAVGVGVELPIGEAFTFTPSFAAGQSEPRLPSGPSPTEFRSGAELSYQFSNDMKVGAGVYHYSDGRIASEKDDAGMVTFSFTVPIGR
jgi:hypothetical protein